MNPREFAANTASMLMVLASLTGCVTASAEDSPRYGLEQALKADPHAGRLKPAAMRKAVSAELRALDNAQPGTLNDWTGPQDVSGTVIPGTPFQVSGSTCRRYEHKITISGEVRSRTATVCRTPDGVWKPLT